MSRSPVDGTGLRDINARHPEQLHREAKRLGFALAQAREDAQPVSWEPEWTRTGTDVDGDPIQLKTRWGDFTGRATLARGGDRKWGAHINYGGGKLFDHGTSEDTVKAWLEAEIRRRVGLEVARANTALALYTHPAPDALRVAVADIAAERNRQINAEGWSEAHDDEHDGHQMARAAGCYAFHASREDDDGDTGMFVSAAVHHGWPWDRAWWKPKSRRADLVRAGALIVAEIERLDRAALQAEQKGGA